jgi:POT family proton-dependent oligopeptide transporter
LAFDATRVGLLVGLLLIAAGSGGIKPCVSAHLGDQYSTVQPGLLSKAYGWFYLSINIGAAISTLLVPVLLGRYGAHVAFALPGVLMALATVVFVLGRSKFVALPPVSFSEYFEQLKDRKTLCRLLETFLLFTLLSVFWSLFDQTGSSWIVQAERLDRTVNVPMFGEVEILAAQIQALNPLLILALVPLFSAVLYPAIERVLPLPPVRRIWIGVAVAASSFAVVGITQRLLDAGGDVSIGWQAVAYVILTAAEVMVSVTALEYAYLRAPKASRSMVMSFYLLSVAMGNLLTALVSSVLSSWYPSVQVVSAGYFLFFAALAAGTAGLMFLLFDSRFGVTYE